MALLPPFLIDANKPLDIETARESLRLRARQSIHSFPLVCGAALLAAAAFSVTTPVWRLVAWALPIILMAALNARVASAVLVGLDGAEPAHIAKRQSWLWFMTAINQTLLGTTVWWIGTDNDLGAATVATTLQLIYLGGALVNASTHPPTFLAGAWVNLGLAAVFWATHSGIGLPLAFGLLSLGLLLTKFANQIASDFRESLRMRFENRDLLARLAQEKKNAEEANAAKSRFLAAASHDLRQPLHALLVFSSLLARNQSEVSPLVGHIKDAAASLDKLFSGLLDISKLETGSVVPQFQAINVYAVADELVREYSAHCTPKQITIRLDGETAWALSDPFLLERVLRNLVDNAVKYTHQGGVVVEVTKGASVVEVRVRDSGIGISPAMSKQIFEEYFQLDNSARDPERGAGLGLAIVRRLAELLQAPVDLASEEGKGSTFSLRLPKAPIFSSSSGGISSVEQEVSLVAGVSVWLVEDNALVRKATCQALEAWGCKVTAWSDAPTAADLSTHSPGPDALVTDYRLGAGLTGKDVIARLRERWPGLPVAVVTGDPSIERAALESLGLVTVMQKPVLPDVLVKWLAGVRPS